MLLFDSVVWHLLKLDKPLENNYGQFGKIFILSSGDHFLIIEMIEILLNWIKLYKRNNAFSAVFQPQPVIIQHTEFQIILIYFDGYIIYV